MADGDLFIHVQVTVDSGGGTVSSGGSAGTVNAGSAGSVGRPTAGSAA